MNISFNNTSNKFEAVVNGVVIASSANMQYLKQKVKNLGHGVPQPGTTYTPHSTVAVAKVPSEFTVDERFEFIERFTKGVAKGSYLSLVLVGGPGLGKTHVVLETLRNLGLSEIRPLEIATVGDDEETDVAIADMLEKNLPLVTDGDFIVIKGFSTPKALYRALFDNNGKVIVLDDADGAFGNPNAANILKGALDSSVPRYISWMSEKKGEDDLPTRFEFTGRIIFISNLTIEQFPPAILSRSVHVDLSLTTEEKIERIEKILAGMDDSNGHVTDVLRLVRNHATRFKELSVRTAIMLMQIRKAETDDKTFERMALYHSVS